MRWGARGFVAGTFAFFAANAHAARISDLVDSSVAEQAARFFREFTSPPILIPTLGCILLGLCCGLLGSFIVVRKQALVGDAISHAVLPGIAAGYLWSMNKNPVALFVGAVIAGLAGAATVSLIEQTTKLKKTLPSESFSPHSSPSVPA